MTLNTLLAYARFYFYRHGWPSVLGLALLVIAISVQTFAVPDLKEQTAAARAAQETLRERAQQAPSKLDAALQQQTAFLANLPGGANASSDAVKAIHRLAAKHGVHLATGEYRVVRDAGEKLQRYQITLPATANYPRLRAWLTDVMNEMPSIALDEISLRREDVGSEKIEARLRFTLFLKNI